MDAKYLPLVAFIMMSRIAEVSGSSSTTRAPRVGSPPYFINLPASTTIPHTAAPGLSVFTVKANDAEDPQGCTNVSIIMTANLQFTFDTNTFEVHTSTLTRMGGAEKLSFTAIDSHRNTATSTLLVYYQNDSTGFMKNRISTLTIKPGTLTTRVKCYDGGVWGYSGYYYVFIVKNKDPVITNLHNSTVVRRDMCKGDDLFTVQAYDPEHSFLRYNMHCKTSPCPFRIFNTGVIKLTRNLRVELEEGYELYINVSDSMENSVEEILTVTFAGSETSLNNRTCPEENGENAHKKEDEEEAVPVAVIVLACVVGLLLIVILVLVVYIVIKGRKGTARETRTSDPDYFTPYNDPVACYDGHNFNTSEETSH